MVRILLVGTGSVGTVYAMLLSKGGADITCVCRSNYALANSHGFTVRSTIFGEYRFRPTIASSVEDVVDNQASDLPFDFVLVCTKALQSQGKHSIPHLIRPAVTKAHTSIVIIQNGLGVENLYRDFFPDNTIISGVTYSPTSRAEAVVFSHTETQRLHLGPFPAEFATSVEKDNTEAFADLIRAGGGDVTVHEDVQIERWKKLIGNTTWNPICALSRSRDLQFLQATPELAQEFVIRSMREVVAVADAAGYGNYIGEGDISKQVQRSKDRKWPGVEPSMLADIKAGGQLEVDAIIGEVVRIGKEKEVDVPRLETLYLLLNCFINATTEA
ncbi:2-dehydropantoate 2-reductase [Aaosphaeria arxii CBS 175.79]|uniref:2-dehydropantoate 2-reductase n=1 Tax=Aaosphaeria arxii CBS 175.79 TaxID=1450172 RepID=A0A6A5XMG5_9PLEO|nr:2-dehydropantoate 2-reductase [Aaosphaeria arxii CBS 175.79]KAF2014096.1 2-dehydropantoate 2-reductase [Aaosphaeria arxii CBS 175.79]